MNRIQMLASAAVVMSLLVLAACQPKPVLTARAGPADQTGPDLTRDLPNKIINTRAELNELGRLAKQCPGRDEAEYRELMRDALGNLLLIYCPRCMVRGRMAGWRSTDHHPRQPGCAANTDVGCRIRTRGIHGACVRRSIRLTRSPRSSLPISPILPPR